MGDTVLELDRLSVAYDQAPVVRDLTLTVGRGEVVALLGANGAGKTTTLRAISGLLKPAGGVIRLDGRDLAGVSPTARARLGLAHVPYDRGIFFGLTVAEHFRLDGTDRPGGTGRPASAGGRAEMDVAFERFPALSALRPRSARKAGKRSNASSISARPPVRPGRPVPGRSVPSRRKCSATVRPKKMPRS